MSSKYKINIKFINKLITYNVVKNHMGFNFTMRMINKNLKRRSTRQSKAATNIKLNVVWPRQVVVKSLDQNYQVPDFLLCFGGKSYG